MSYLHLIIGTIGFIIFVTTGRFMRWDFPDKEIIPPELRILMRSRHIYILFSALLHLLVGVYLQISSQIWRKILQLFGSTLLILASGFLLWGFIHETYYAKTFSDLSRWGIYLSLAGVGFHLIGGFLSKNER